MSGRDKGLIEWNGRPMVSYSVDVLRKIADPVYVSANRHLCEYESLGLRVVADGVVGFQGPLAGVLSAMKLAQTPYLVTLPCDTPLIDIEVLNRLVAAFLTEEADVCVAGDGQRLHPVIMIAACVLAPSIEEFLVSGERKLQLWLRHHKAAVVDFRDCAHKLANINTPEELLGLNGPCPPA